MTVCGLFFWIIVVLLLIAGVSYILGADKLGDFALDVIRVSIIFVLLVVLVALILILIGRWNWRDIFREASMVYDIIRLLFIV